MDGQTQSVPRVLLVDDDTDFLNEMRYGLDVLGFPALTAHTAVEALDLVRQNDALRVVVTDLNLPRIGGIELLQKLSLRRRRHPLSAIILTGHATIDRVVSALRVRAVDFLQKPAAPEEVANAIARALMLMREPPEPATTTITGAIDRSDYLRALVAARADRATVFQVDLFCDPTWEMMLDLAMAESCNRWISVTSLCIASGAPTTTALRRIDDLRAAGLVDKVPDPHDKRRIVVCLTPLGRERMEAFVQRQAERMGLRLD
ncbi:response regulator [Xanthobacter sp. V4C-4]|uniref:response regulator n=1 Tax=Xanthobacter cornucopiae TaxID=3119924 RepID=UPI00372A4694